MATIKGQNLRVLLGDDTNSLKCIAASTSCTMHAALQVQEDTTKDTDDDWMRQEPVGVNWDVQVEALVISDDDGDYRPGAHAIDQMQVGRAYILRFARTAGASGEQNRDAVQDSIQLTGTAILNDLTITSQNGEVATAVAQFTGTAELRPYNIEERPIDNDFD